MDVGEGAVLSYQMSSELLSYLKLMAANVILSLSAKNFSDQSKNELKAFNIKIVDIDTATNLRHDTIPSVCSSWDVSRRHDVYSACREYRGRLNPSPGRVVVTSHGWLKFKDIL
jgi:hypothetical protein